MTAAVVDPAGWLDRLERELAEAGEFAAAARVVAIRAWAGEANDVIDRAFDGRRLRVCEHIADGQIRADVAADVPALAEDFAADDPELSRPALPVGMAYVPPPRLCPAHLRLGLMCEPCAGQHRGTVHTGHRRYRTCRLCGAEGSVTRRLELVLSVPVATVWRSVRGHLGGRVHLDPAVLLCPDCGTRLPQDRLEPVPVLVQEDDRRGGGRR